jgi:myo-inositol-1(or 4)-monophosphatase
LSFTFMGTAAEAVLKSGAIQKARYGQRITIEHKGVINIVTEVDKACEAAILEVLRSRFPSHDIVTEETDLARTGSPYVWYIDPLDGTTNFAHGYPCFCTSLALVHEGTVIAGAIYDPLRQELFTAERGVGSFLNGRRLRVSTTSRLIDSLLLTGFPYDVREHLVERLRLFNTFIGVAQAVRRDGSAALDLCYVAAGRVEAFWEENLHPWDILAGILMIEEAGGRISRFDGSSVGVRADQLVATNGHIHDAMLEVVKGATLDEAGVAKRHTRET